MKEERVNTKQPIPQKNFLKQSMDAKSIKIHSLLEYITIKVKSAFHIMLLKISQLR